MAILPKIPFYFIRHGHTDWNISHRCMGQINVVLNQHGIKQAHNAAKLLIQLDIKTICFSPLLRAKRTADIINETLKTNMVEINSLKEANLGTLQGSQDDATLERWKGGICPKRAEPYNHFLIRINRALETCLDYPGPILIISHGGVYGAIQHLLNLETIYNLDNCVPINYIPPIDTCGSWSQSCSFLN